MKRTVKEVRTMKNVFIAVDGKEFEDYEEALYYEHDLYRDADELRMFDAEGLATNAMDCEVVVFRSEGALHSFIEVSDYEGYETTGLDYDSELGMYFWETVHNKRGWYTPKNLLEIRKNEINEVIMDCGGELLE